jgi:Protein of unknown function (DUF3309)
MLFISGLAWFGAMQVHVIADDRNKRGTPTGDRESNGTFRVPMCFSSPKAEQQVPAAGREERFMSLGTIILIILVIALLGGFSGIGGGPFYGTGYYGGGGLGLVIVILLILLLLGRL